MGAEPPVTPSEELSLFLVAAGDLLDAKARALMHQISQTGPVLAAMGEAGYRAMIAEEAYRRAGE
jgi:methylmalonyl-CoA mutase N-terminal domain/subunit